MHICVFIIDPSRLLGSPFARINVNEPRSISTLISHKSFARFPHCRSQAAKASAGSNGSRDQVFLPSHVTYTISTAPATDREGRDIVCKAHDENEMSNHPTLAPASATGRKSQRIPNSSSLSATLICPDFRTRFPRPAGPPPVISAGYGIFGFQEQGDDVGGRGWD